MLDVCTCPFDDHGYDLLRLGFTLCLWPWSVAEDRVVQCAACTRRCGLPPSFIKCLVRSAGFTPVCFLLLYLRRSACLCSGRFADRLPCLLLRPGRLLRRTLITWAGQSSVGLSSHLALSGIICGGCSVRHSSRPTGEASAHSTRRKSKVPKPVARRRGSAAHSAMWRCSRHLAIQTRVSIVKVKTSTNQEQEGNGF